MDKQERQLLKDKLRFPVRAAVPGNRYYYRLVCQWFGGSSLWPHDPRPGRWEESMETLETAFKCARWVEDHTDMSVIEIIPPDIDTHVVTQRDVIPWTLS